MTPLLESATVNAVIDGLLIRGDAQTAAEAEALFLDSHLHEIARLVAELDDAEFLRHDAIKLLFAHGSRPWEGGTP